MARSDGGESIFVADLFTLREFDALAGDAMSVVLGWSPDDVVATPATVAADGQELVLTSWFANAVQVYDPVAVELCPAKPNNLSI